MILIDNDKYTTCDMDCQEKNVTFWGVVDLYNILIFNNYIYYDGVDLIKEIVFYVNK